MAEPLPDAVKFLNQRFLAEGCLTTQQLNHIWDNELADFEKGNCKNLAKALSVSSRQLATVGMEIRAVAFNDEKYYALINKQNDEISKLGFHSGFTTTEINYIRLIFQELAGGPCTRANLVNAKNALKEEDKLELSDAIKIVNRLVADHWIQPETGTKKRQSMKANLKLGPRAYMELSYMLVEQFGMDKNELPQQFYL